MKTIRQDQLGTATLRLVQTPGSYVGLLLAGKTIRKRIEGPEPQALWEELRRDAGKADPAYFGFEGARERFRTFFPDGFHSEHFDAMERRYKLAAKAKLDASIPLDEAASGSDYGPAALSAFQATNLLSPFEKTRLQALLRSPEGDAFVQAAARFASGEIEGGLQDMERLLRPHDNAKWTVVTYLPFLWRPDIHMFLKPTVTQDYATRVGHPFAHAYAPALDASVYESLRDLAEETRAALADLHPRDAIDLQSFIWIIGEYKDETAPAA